MNCLSSQSWLEAYPALKNPVPLHFQCNASCCKVKTAPSVRVRISRHENFRYIMRTVADVAQLVEQRIRNAKVTSSIPVIGTRSGPAVIYCRPFSLLSAFILLLGVFSSAHSQQISLNIEDIVAPSFQIREIAASLENNRFSASIGELTLQGQTWKNVHLSCPKIRIEHDTIACDQGILKEKQSWPVRFSFSPNMKRLSLDLSPAVKERWRIDARWGNRWEVVADIENGNIAHVKPWLPANIPTPSAGNVSGKFRLSGSGAKLLAADADLRLSNLAFSDTSGLHAGEKISGKITLKARQERKDMAWQGQVHWDQGEIYWHPLYVSGGGVQLVASGHSSPQRIELERGVLNWPAIGEVSASAVWDRTARQFSAAALEGKELNLGPLHAAFLLPFLEKTALAKSVADGKVRLLQPYRQRGGAGTGPEPGQGLAQGQGRVASH